MGEEGKGLYIMQHFALERLIMASLMRELSMQLIIQ
jgi:hypothetical protein